MARPRQPVDLVLAKGKKHLTKEEIESRRDTEIKVGNDNIVPPSFLTSAQKKEFKYIADELTLIGIMSNLDCDALARYLVAKDSYIKYTKLLHSIPAEIENIVIIDKATSIQDKAYKQCQSAARELGLTISSRCKLVMPTKKEEKPENKFAKFMGGERTG